MGAQPSKSHIILTKGSEPPLRHPCLQRFWLCVFCCFCFYLDLLFEMFLIQSANLIKEILKTTAYKPPKNAEIGKNNVFFWFSSSMNVVWMCELWFNLLAWMQLSLLQRRRKIFEFWGICQKADVCRKKVEILIYGCQIQTLFI